MAALHDQRIAPSLGSEGFNLFGLALASQGRVLPTAVLAKAGTPGFDLTSRKASNNALKR
jgi:hypothetical protein